jgi:hypothetical protein
MTQWTISRQTQARLDVRQVRPPATRPLARSGGSRRCALCEVLGSHAVVRVGRCLPNGRTGTALHDAANPCIIFRSSSAYSKSCASFRARSPPLRALGTRAPFARQHCPGPRTVLLPNYRFRPLIVAEGRQRIRHAGAGSDRWRGVARCVTAIANPHRSGFLVSDRMANVSDQPAVKVQFSPLML